MWFYLYKKDKSLAHDSWKWFVNMLDTSATMNILYELQNTANRMITNWPNKSYFGRIAENTHFSTIWSKTTITKKWGHNESSENSEWIHSKTESSLSGPIVNTSLYIKRAMCKFCPSSNDNKTYVLYYNCKKHIWKSHVKYYIFLSKIYTFILIFIYLFILYSKSKQNKLVKKW